ncbi:hypothetical protein [Clavibacter sp. VKM Ac-2872]|uniref:hypothetical protein n=1 Tax=Clavibacter sp. VKM Ac-2872 TaxID=2783812 RepID=UPI00188BCA29|nr:hypothetical protein [Clavibacter sp. VKM Ac-2872]MBF4625619.1 hypothetical protein [Clavibacter sp. VKM Ac-2872]
MGAVVTTISLTASAALMVTTTLHPTGEARSRVVQSSPALLGTSDATVSASRAVSDAQDDQLGQMLSLLESLPEDLKQADPKTTPNYANRLTAEINARRGGASEGSSIASSSPVISTALFARDSGGPGASTTGPRIELAVNWFACATDIVGLIVQYGVPVGKVIGWIKDARAIYGSVRAIAAAIRRGDFGVTEGEDAAQVLEGLLGIDGVIADCFT